MHISTKPSANKHIPWSNTTRKTPSLLPRDSNRLLANFLSQPNSQRGIGQWLGWSCNVPYWRYESNVKKGSPVVQNDVSSVLVTQNRQSSDTKRISPQAILSRIWSLVWIIAVLNNWVRNWFYSESLLSLSKATSPSWWPEAQRQKYVFLWCLFLTSGSE